MIISFPPRNKRKKKRERETAALNNHTIKTIKSDFEVGLTSKSQQYICWRNGVLGSADRRRWAAVSWATGSAPIYSSAAGLLLGCRGHCSRVPTHGARVQTARVHSPFTAVQDLSRDPTTPSKSAECEPDVASAHART